MGGDGVWGIERGAWGEYERTLKKGPTVCFVNAQIQGFLGSGMFPLVLLLGCPVDGCGKARSVTFANK